MAKKYASRKTASVKCDKTMEQLLQQVPNHLFATMVAKSGMPTDEARDLNQQFQENK